ncbi:MAG: hypothetical protein GXO23_07865 [Crenarchaeota archaeon]|nr:hypothetical protein [Thermoproteota archaeon]
MTGPGPGKIEIDCEKVEIEIGRKTLTLRPKIYIHIKGWSLARVTHIDIEHENIENVLGIKRGEIVGGFLIRHRTNVEIISKKFRLKIYSKTLLKLVPENYKGGCVIGGKMGGIFIGIRKELIQILEEYGKTRGYEPKK